MTDAERAAMQAEFDAFIAEAPKRADRLRQDAAHFADHPDIAALMLRIADHQSGYAEFAGARLETAQGEFTGSCSNSKI